MKRSAITVSPMALALMASTTTGIKVNISVGGRVMPATLSNNPTSLDFASMLPLTLTLSDYAGTEKIAYLSRRLSTTGAPAGSKPTAGTIAFYAPWGNLAIFHQDFAYSPGLISLGRVDGDLSVLRCNGSLAVRIEHG